MNSNKSRSTNTNQSRQSAQQASTADDKKPNTTASLPIRQSKPATKTPLSSGKESSTSSSKVQISAGNSAQSLPQAATTTNGKTNNAAPSIDPRQNAVAQPRTQIIQGDAEKSSQSQQLSGFREPKDPKKNEPKEPSMESHSERRDLTIRYDQRSQMTAEQLGDLFYTMPSNASEYRNTKHLCLDCRDDGTSQNNFFLNALGQRIPLIIFWLPELESATIKVPPFRLGFDQDEKLFTEINRGLRLCRYLHTLELEVTSLNEFDSFICPEFDYFGDCGLWLKFVREKIRHLSITVNGCLIGEHSYRESEYSGANVPFESLDVLESLTITTINDQVPLPLWNKQGNLKCSKLETLVLERVETDATTLARWLEKMERLKRFRLVDVHLKKRGLEQIFLVMASCSRRLLDMEILYSQYVGDQPRSVHFNQKEVNQALGALQRRIHWNRKEIGDMESGLGALSLLNEPEPGIERWQRYGLKKPNDKGKAN
ncbi:MAG: hypothetical protein M1820_008539 [Bogoriella megaspora]|nr:MAG: hypothetical protein M1820_008539 [Bogoriella megaspora]